MTGRVLDWPSKRTLIRAFAIVLSLAASAPPSAVALAAAQDAADALAAAKPTIKCAQHLSMIAEKTSGDYALFKWTCGSNSGETFEIRQNGEWVVWASGTGDLDVCDLTTRYRVPATTAFKLGAFSGSDQDRSAAAQAAIAALKRASSKKPLAVATQDALVEGYALVEWTWQKATGESVLLGENGSWKVLGGQPDGYSNDEIADKYGIPQSTVTCLRDELRPLKTAGH